MNQPALVPVVTLTAKRCPHCGRPVGYDPDTATEPAPEPSGLARLKCWLRLDPDSGQFSNGCLPA